MPPESFVKIGSIIGAHGIRGEIKLLSFLEDAESIIEFSPLLTATGKPLLSSLTITGRQKEALIVKASNITDRNAAELLKGKELYIPASALPALEDGEQYQSQLIGMEAKLENGEPYGKITGIYNFGAGDVIDIKKPNGELEMLPLKEGFVEIKDGQVIVWPPEYVENK